MALPYQYGCWRSHNETQAQMSWLAMQPTKGSYVGNGSDQAAMVVNYSIFDTRLAEAEAVNVSVCWMLWRTPAWASVPGDQVGGSNTVVGAWNAAGESAVPANMQYIYDFVYAAISRANSGGRRRIKYIELWNEPEFYDASELATLIGQGKKPYFTGTAQQMVRMCWTARVAAKTADPGIIVLAPSQYLQTKLAAFLGAQDPVTGKFGYETFDYINLHPYTVTPNQAMGGIDIYNAGGVRIGVRAANNILAALGQPPKPVAITEWNIAPATDDPGVAAFNALPTATRKLYVERFIYMCAACGVKLCCIFSNSNGNVNYGGDYVNDIDGVIAGVNAAHQTLRGGRTLIPGTGFNTDTGAVTLKFADGGSITR